MVDAVKNIKNLNKHVGFLKSVLKKINNTDIRYVLYAGSHVSVLTSNRIATDVDFLVHDEDIYKLKELFPFAQTKDYGDGIFLFIGGKSEIEFMSQADVNVGESHYSYRLTDLAWNHTELVDCGDFKVRLVNPIDTILLKAAYQRGKDLGKHDIEDIEALIEHCEIDRDYLRKRLDEFGKDTRIVSVLQQYHLVT